MSASMRIAKAQYRGDPGLFGFLGDAIGKVAGIAGSILPGPIGMVAKGVSSLLNKPASNGKPLNPSVTNTARALPATAINILQAHNVPSLQRPSVLPQIPTQVDSTRTSGVSLFPGGPMVGTQTTYSSPAGKPGAPCGSGFHTNKTGYYTRQGYVAPGSKCVKNRKRNPLNPRAASRAMSRLSSAKKAAKFLGSVSIREKGCGCK